MKKPFYGLFVFLILAFAASNAYSCSCGENTQRQEFKRSKFVFIGKFIKYGGDEQTGTLVELKITKSWKGGQAGRNITLNYADLDGCDYDLNFMPGKQYLIYAVQSSDKKYTFVSVDCGRSRPIEDAINDIKKMDKVARS